MKINLFLDNKLLSYCLQSYCPDSYCLQKFTVLTTLSRQYHVYFWAIYFKSVFIFELITNLIHELIKITVHRILNWGVNQFL